MGEERRSQEVGGVACEDVRLPRPEVPGSSGEMGRQTLRGPWIPTMPSPVLH